MGNHAKQVALAEMTPLQDKMTERIRAQNEEIERLKRITNMDAVWQSFAHVESLIKGLHARLDKLDCPKGNGRTGGSTQRSQSCRPASADRRKNSEPQPKPHPTSSST